MTQLSVANLFELFATSAPIHLAIVFVPVDYTGADPSSATKYIVIEFAEPSLIFFLALVRHSITSL